VPRPAAIGYGRFTYRAQLYIDTPVLARRCRRVLGRVLNAAAAVNVLGHAPFQSNRGCL
jgi:hypothetical protein